MSRNGEISLTSLVSKQCLRWDCFRLPTRQDSEDYCHENCLQMVTSGSQSSFPFPMSDYFYSTSEFAPVASKILNSLKANKNNGVPHLSQHVFQTPPWESNMFNVEFDVREEHFEWLFTGSGQIPQSSSGFEWRGGRSEMIGGEGRRGKYRMIGGEVRHCVFKPFPNPDNRWELHQYSLPEMMDKAVYVLRCINPLHQPFMN